jgi:hypothetical protein
MFAAAVMGVFLLIWSNQSLNHASLALTDTFDSSINRLAEEILIDQVWFGTGSSSKFVNVTLSNISSIGITITEIELVNSTDTYAITVNQNVFPGDTFSIEEEYIWTTGTATDVTVFTARENQIKTQVSP